MSFVKVAKEFFTAVREELDPYVSKKGEIEVKSFKTVILHIVRHIQWAKYGRGPGKKPPLDNILKYVKFKGIVFEDTDSKGTAFIIQKSIGEKGTLNWVPNAPNAIKEALDKHSPEFIKKTYGVVRLEAKDEVYKVVKGSLKKENYKIKI